METCTACHRLFRRRGGLQLHVYNSPSCLLAINQEQNRSKSKGGFGNSTTVVEPTNELQQCVNSNATESVLMDIDSNNELEDSLFPSSDDTVAQDIPMGLHQQATERTQHNDLMVTSLQDAAEIELLRLVRSINAPLYAFDHINNWAGRQNACGYTFPPNIAKQFLSKLI